MPLENPYRHGAYFFTLATLIKLGVNRSHKFSAFAAKLKQLWNQTDPEGWKAFAEKPARNQATAKDLNGRIFQNCRVLQRVRDYGKPLLKAGAVIDLTRGAGGDLMIALNTHSKKPQKPGRAPMPPKTKPKPAKDMAKSSRKTTCGKKVGRNRSVKVTEAVPGTSTVSEPTKPVIDESAKTN